jgi:hypothetical protein
MQSAAFSHFYATGYIVEYALVAYDLCVRAHAESQLFTVADLHVLELCASTDKGNLLGELVWLADVTRPDPYLITVVPSHHRIEHAAIAPRKTNAPQPVRFHQASEKHRLRCLNIVDTVVAIVEVTVINDSLHIFVDGKSVIAAVTSADVTENKPSALSMNVERIVGKVLNGEIFHIDITVMADIYSAAPVISGQSKTNRTIFSGLHAVPRAMSIPVGFSRLETFGLNLVDILIHHFHEIAVPVAHAGEVGAMAEVIRREEKSIPLRHP